MHRRFITLLSASAFVLFTSVYCDRDYSCSGFVYEAGTTTPIDSVSIMYPSGFASTDAGGHYQMEFHTSKEPRLEFNKEGYEPAYRQKCKENDVVEMQP